MPAKLKHTHEPLALAAAMDAPDLLGRLNTAIEMEPERDMWLKAKVAALSKMPPAPPLEDIETPYTASWIDSELRDRFIKEKTGATVSHSFCDAPVFALTVEDDSGDDDNDGSDSPRKKGGSPQKTSTPLWSIVVHDEGGDDNVASDRDSAYSILMKQSQACDRDAAEAWSKAVELTGGEEQALTLKGRLALASMEGEESSKAPVGYSDDAIAAIHQLIGAKEAAATHRDRAHLVRRGEFKLSGGKKGRVLFVGKCSTQSKDGLIGSYLRGKTPEVVIIKPAPAGSGQSATQVRCPVLSAIAEERLESLLEDWRSWLLALSDDVRQQLEDDYFEQYGCRDFPDFSGIGETFGFRQVLADACVDERFCLDPTAPKYLRGYQLDAIFRFAMQGGIAAHEVGLGKTTIGVCVFAARRYWGKTAGGPSFYFVPANKIEDWAQAFAELSPSVKVATVTSDPAISLTKAIASGAEVVICSHYQINNIPVSPDGIDRIFARNKSELERLFWELPEHERQKNTTGQYTSAAAKILQQNIARIDTARDKLKVTETSAGLYWEDFNCPFIFVDELQVVKNNVPGSSYAGVVKGVNPSQSKRARSLELKLELMRMNGIEHPLVGATGTPEPTNELSGMYAMLRLFCPEKLKRMGISSFDSFLMNFGRTTSEPELRHDGTYRKTMRLRGFNDNLRDLNAIYFSFLDYRLYADVVGDIRADQKRPEVKLEEHVACKPSPLQAAIQRLTVARFQRLAKLGRFQKPAFIAKYGRDADGDLHPYGWVVPDNYEADEYEQALATKKVKKKPILLTPHARRSRPCVAHGSPENFLSLYNDLKAVAIGPLLVDLPTIVANFPEEQELCRLALDLMERPRLHPEEKMAVAAKHAAEIYHRTAEHRIVQLIAIDRHGIKFSKKSTADLIQEELIAHGVKPEEIAQIWDYNKKTQAEDLEPKLRSGEIRVLIGSRAKIGVGLNIQDRLYAIHSIDVPARPDENMQLRGRAERPGNICQQLFGEVKFYHYITQSYQIEEGGKTRPGADATFLQALLAKIELLRQLLSPEARQRGFSFDEGTEAMTCLDMFFREATGGDEVEKFFSLHKAIAKLKVRLQSADASLDKLTSLDRHRHGSIASYRRDAERHRQRLSHMNEIRDYLASNAGDPNTFAFVRKDGIEIVGKDKRRKRKDGDAAPKTLVLTRRQARDAVSTWLGELATKLSAKETALASEYSSGKRNSSTTHNFGLVGTYRGLQIHVKTSFTRYNGEVLFTPKHFYFKLVATMPDGEHYETTLDSTATYKNGAIFARIDEHLDSIANSVKQLSAQQKIADAESAVEQARQRIAVTKETIAKTKTAIAEREPELESLRQTLVARGFDPSSFY